MRCNEREFFLTEKAVPQTFLLLECMQSTSLGVTGRQEDLFSETYTFNCSREERESDQVNLVDRGTVLGDFLVYNVTTFTFICC